MQLRTVAVAVLAGVAPALVVFVAVSEALLDVVGFSVLVGIPAGLVAGALVSALTLRGLTREGRSSAFARGAGAFAVTLIAVFALGVGAGAGILAATGVAVLVGLLGGAVAYLHARQLTG